MSLKVVLVALAVVCAAQAYAIDNGHVDTRGPPVDGSAMFARIAKMLEQARSEIKDLQVNVKKGIDYAFESVKGYVESQTKIWYDTIDKAVEKAKEQGVDVSECISETHVLAEIRQKALAESRQCVANEEPTADAAIKKLDDLLVEDETILNKAEEAVKQCDGQPMLEALRCNAEVLAPLAEEAEQLVMKSFFVFGDIGDMVGKTSVKINKCVLGVVGTEVSAAGKIVSKATKCINEKLRG